LSGNVALGVGQDHFVQIQPTIVALLCYRRVLSRRLDSYPRLGAFSALFLRIEQKITMFVVLGAVLLVAGIAVITGR
jgi:hypothetical protein